MIPVWLQTLSIIYLITGFGSAFAIIYNIWIKKNRQKMRIMNIVWPVNAWFLGPFGYWAYKKIGMQSVRMQQKHNMQQQSKQQHNRSQQRQQQHHQQQMQQEHNKKTAFTKNLYRVNSLCDRMYFR
jgi:thiol:disulfide interchange protein